MTVSRPFVEDVRMPCFDGEGRARLVRALIEGEESGLSDRTVRDIIADTKSAVGKGQT
jgi:hypothetical protein